MKIYPEMRFGLFIAPLHAASENPTLALEQDLDLIELGDKLDYDEVWVGEHHSTGVEIVGSPELLIAAAAERTKHIRLGTGVNSLCFHHPFILAERLVQLDHQTRGRIMFGTGPGQLPGDAYMLGISPTDQRRMMGQALEVIIPLLRGETVTYECDWFRLQEARLHLRPYQASLEMAAATALSLNGPTLAGKHGIGMLGLAAGSPAAFDKLKDHWRVYQETATQHGKTVDRRNWRLMATVHLADTQEQAMHEVRHAVVDKLHYYRAIFGEEGSKQLNVPATDSATEAVAAWTDRNGQGLGAFGIGIIGTPEYAVEQILRYQESSGGFGCFLMFSHNCTSWDATRRSLELFARKVVPAIRGTNRSRIASLDWTTAMADRLVTSHFVGEKPKG